ncbi:MAG: ABC transporter ATP-binding protein/permease [Oscillospiraceae bacterium]|jgi:ATP-binding cassette subfamily B protein|nr:ABC transporter ATP-binding protein/permease [Oscillospiraceae bacterium]
MEEKKPEEKKLKGLAKVKYVFFLLKPYWKHGRAFMVVTVALAAVFQPISTSLTALLPKYAIDAVMAGKPRGDILLVIGLFTLGIALVSVAQKVVELGYSRPMKWKIDRRIGNDVNEKALFSDFKYYDNPDFFKKFNFAQEEFAWQAWMAMSLFPNIVKDVVTVGFMTAIITQADPVLLGVALAFVVLNGVVGIPTIKPEADWRVKSTDVWRPLDYVSRMLRQKENAAELRSSGAGLKFLDTIDAVTKNFNAAFLTFRRKVLPFNIAEGFITPLQAGCVLVYIILFIIDGDITKIGLYASLTAASATMAQNLGWIGDNVKNILQLSLNGERIAAFFEAKSEIEPPREGAAAPPEGVYDIEFRDVSFGYDKAAFGIERLNLHLKPGQRVAIVGENGAGKTTLTKLLLRLYDVTGGQMLINGVDIRDYDIHKLRLHIGVAFQDVRVLAMSLRDNLTVYHEAPDERLMKVIRRLGLESVVEKARADSEDKSDKAALDRMVSREFTEDGVALSGGEAQRLTLARLFTGEFGLLVLDEPSAALDPLAEYKLMQIILDASNTATTLMIAHRLSTVRDFDVIYHMENGAILESGTHDELMAARGKYCEMFTRQAENYQSEAAL